MTFLSVMVARLVTSRFEALQANLDLQLRLLQITEESKVQLAQQLAEARTQIARDEKNATFAEVALEVAHNLRSPLAALELKLHEIQVSPESKAMELRDAIHRIRDIANQLVLTGQKARKDSDPAASAPSPSKEPYDDVLVPILVDSIVSEKRLEYRAQNGVRIRFDMLPSAYGLFARIQPGVFRTVLSNLINNAVEAGTENRVEIIVRVEPGAETGQINVTVDDNGIGTPDEVLAAIGNRRVSAGKAHGSGIGLVHAHESVARWGGVLQLERRLPVGTRASVTLPATEAPRWFETVLPTPAPNAPYVVVDDDPNIHSIWRSKLPKGRVCAHADKNSLIAWINSHPEESKSAHYLFDFDLGKDRQTGLDLINEFGLLGRSTLVSSHFDRAQLLASCMESGVRIVPKAMVAVLPS